VLQLPRRRCHVCVSATVRHLHLRRRAELTVLCRPHVRKRKRDGLDVVTEQRSPVNRSQLDEPAGQQVDEPHEPSYLGRADYLDTHAPIDEYHVSRYQRSPGQSAFAGVDLSTPLEGLLTRSARESLVSSFLRSCRPWMPLLTAEQVYAMFEANSVPTFLMLAILVAGSKVSTSPQAQELGQNCYDAAKLRFYSCYAKDTLDTITGTIIIQWWNQTGPEHISIDNSSTWLRLGVALAHQTGLHRQPDSKSPQFARRRKIWWTLVVRQLENVTKFQPTNTIPSRETIR
jgi:hypothetical protein